MSNDNATPLPAFVVSTLVLLIACSALGYYLYQAHTTLRDQQHRLGDLSSELNSAISRIRDLDQNLKETKREVAVLRVTLQQVADVQIDKSGAIIKRKGSRPDGIELR